jgi:hypothetical protein
MLLDQVLEGYAHFLLNDTRVIDVTADTEELGSLIALSTESSEPTGTSSTNCGGDCNGLDIGDSGGTTEETNIGREGRF